MFDLHTHSNFSDGTLPPEKLIEEAKASGLSLVALTDHDTAAGIPIARAAAHVRRMPFLPGIEMEAEYSDQLHILGLGVDPRSEHLAALIALQNVRRNKRNDATFALLEKDGLYVRPFIDPAPGTLTRANIAAALYKAGHCSSISEAFRRYLGRGNPYYVPQPHPDKLEVLEAISEAGGISVLAHPMKMKCNHRGLLRELRAAGLWGVEAYYGASPEEHSNEFSELAREFGLRITCGSDFHGLNRPGVALGCAYRPVPELDEAERELFSRFPGLGALSRPIRRQPARRVLTLNEFQLYAERAAAQLPQDLFIGLNGGVVISERAKLHKKSLPGRPLYIMGEYHYGGGEGRYITLYYGSFRAVHGTDSPEELAERVKAVLLHEFRHHLETRAGEHDLEYEDDASIAEYLEENAPRPADMARVPRPTSVTYGDPYDQR